MKKKMLIVTTVSVTLEAFLLPYGEHFRGKGWQVDCLGNGAMKSKSCKNSFDRCYDIGWGRSPLDLKNMTTYPEQVRKLVRKNKYDIVHVHTPVASFVTRLALRKLKKETGTKVIYTAHGFHFYRGGNLIKNTLFLSLEKLASSWTDHLVVINEEDYQSAIKYLMPKKKVTWMKGGIGLDRSYYSPQAISQEEVNRTRRELGLKDDDILFTMIAEFNPGKRHRDLIKAFSMVKDRRVHLALIGSGHLLKETQKTCRELKIADRVHFTGKVPDVRPYIMASRATILTSEREGLPRSVMESLAMGIPVIGADARGTRDLLQETPSLIFKVGDIKNLAQKLLSVIKGKKLVDDNISQSYGYDVWAIISKTGEIYKRLGKNEKDN